MKRKTEQRIIMNNKSGKFDTQKCNQTKNIFIYKLEKNPKNEHQSKPISAYTRKDRRYRICSTREKMRNRNRKSENIKLLFNVLGINVVELRWSSILAKFHYMFVNIIFTLKVSHWNGSFLVQGQDRTFLLWITTTCFITKVQQKSAFNPYNSGGQARKNTHMHLYIERRHWLRHSVWESASCMKITYKSITNSIEFYL